MMSKENMLIATRIKQLYCQKQRIVQCTQDILRPIVQTKGFIES